MAAFVIAANLSQGCVNDLTGGVSRECRNRRTERGWREYAVATARFFQRQVEQAQPVHLHIDMRDCVSASNSGADRYDLHL
ncbi:hypothetical protein T8J41_15920 [Nitratireductor rhodophyticola]|uniref:hypothetical protein n=1 Tax=Nitratireductor rhodophyticola TaxID=2854036 RepID=UPI002AC92EBF|nr:hypothetical protein [Nitratireductor rhodophyticola]WPZ13620.1 hypothetical protein T8J41_15920 [Nitratireductor rhodophyticola]